MTPQLSADEVSYLRAELDNFKAQSKKAKATGKHHGPTGSSSVSDIPSPNTFGKAYVLLHWRNILLVIVDCMI